MQSACLDFYLFIDEIIYVLLMLPIYFLHLESDLAFDFWNPLNYLPESFEYMYFNETRAHW